MLKKILKFLLFLFLGLVGVLIIIYLYMDESKPVGTKGLQAEQLTDEMLQAINKPAFDSLQYITFTFAETNSYEWDRVKEEVVVKWEGNTVKVPLYQGMDTYDELQVDAYQRFVNDSFWLTAPFKARDNGVLRSVVDTEQGRGLLLEYTSGGLTPGDAYLWIIDEKGFPIAWKLWTSNVPLGGLEFSWEGWTQQSHTWFSTSHKSKYFEIPITNLTAQ